ncbi:MAG: DNA-directed RNA polymerase subunit B, partial [Candidatus Aenigmarchaeota archaeon]|nr:DNA-directed RNA polymerase subunit B [Candidatus Aenigmarchaeota archaeon]
MADVFIDGRFVGQAKEPEKMIEFLREKRRAGKIPDQVNFSYLDYLNEIRVVTDEGRVRRPLIIIENGKPKLTQEHIEKIQKGEIMWHDLINNGIIEYLDTEEEENALVALRSENLTKEHTHLELDPLVIFGISTSFVPFPEFDRGDRVNFGSKMVGQSIGLYSTNFLRRVDTKSNILVYPQKSLVKTHIDDVLHSENHPGGQNIVIAVMSFKCFNIEDAIIMNKSSVERGLFWSYLFRTYEAEEKKYMGGQEDIIGIPEPGVKGYAGEEAYKHLPEDGIINPEIHLTDEQIIVGKTSPLRFLGSLDQFITDLENIRETSVKLRHGEEGIVDRVFITESADGNKLVKVVVRDLKRPEIGDKFASRHGQKGVIGLIIPEEDLPFTEDGVIPDIIFNPHSIPSRMTIGKLLEIIGGKVCALNGKRSSNSAFHPTPEKDFVEALEKNGFKGDGKEALYDADTGEKYTQDVFM